MNDVERWSINESLLQSYRSIFVSSQAFLLAVGAIVIDKSIWVLFATAVVGWLMIWWIWVPVVRSRHLIVDYYKFQIGFDRDRLSALCSEHEYVQDASSREKANQLLGIKTNWRPTRRKIDFWIPVLFSLVWVLFMFSNAVGI